MPMTNTIYHYSSLEAFEKIVESGRIRATHYSNFEDKQELHLGVRLLLDAVMQFPIDPSDRGYRDFLVEAIKGFADGQLQVYVLSLTERRDSAHHWRNYALCGVAIGFCRDRVQRGFPIDISGRMPGRKIENPIRPDPANRLMRCRYVSQFDLPQLVGSRFFAPNSYPAGFRDEFASRHPIFFACLSVSIYQTICAIKGPDFVDDDEWRCVHFNPDDKEYPVTRDGKRQFIELQFEPTDFINDILIGPQTDRRKCDTAIERLRLLGRIKGFPIGASPAVVT